MRICLFADARSVHIHQLTKALCTEGHSVHIVTHKPTQVRGATVERFHVSELGLHHPHRWRRRLRDYLRGFVLSFDVVNIHFLSDWGFRPEEGDWDDGCVVCSAWGSDIFDPPGETPADAELLHTRRIMLNHADKVTACGRSFAQVVAAFGGLSEYAVVVAPFGVDCDQFQPQPASTRGERALRAGCFKGFRPVYGVPCFIRAMPFIAAAVPFVEFEFIGDGSQLDECQQLAKECGIAERIHWIGRRAHGELPSLIAGWDMSVMPSIHEAFGVAALESSAMEIPVVSSTAVGFRDTVQDGVTGSVVRTDDPQVFADCVVRLLLDQDRRRKMGTEGRKWVQGTFDWKVIAPQWTSVFELARERTLTMV